MKQKRYWAKFDKSGEMTAFIQGEIGPHFFSNAENSGERVGIVTVTEVPMNHAEAKLANACPACGQQRPARSTSNG